VVGTDSETGAEITAQNGRYGPYLRRGTDSRSLVSEDQIFEITLDDALAVYAQPKTRGRQAAAPLRELGADPESGGTIQVKDGRFGPYVTDGTTNATLRKGDDAQTITLERAAELLAEKRAKGPAPARGRRKASTTRSSTDRSTTEKKATAKSATGTKAPAKQTKATKGRTAAASGAATDA